MGNIVKSSESIAVTPELIQCYDRPGPRYTSYPTTPEWQEDFDATEYAAALAKASASESEPISFYVHIPFCQHRCAFCGCNVVISKHPEVSEEYLDHVAKEIAMVAEALGGRRSVAQLHWGGGTPSFLGPDDMKRLFDSIDGYFDLDDAVEIGIEVDPRVTTREQVALLRQLGFNRISMGVQDFDSAVQKAIGRNQTEGQTRDLFGWAREDGYQGINIDLIYGLPKQTIDGWTRTLESIVDIHPDRLAVYSYAHLPGRMKHQARIDEHALPTPTEKFDLLVRARDVLTGAGYRAIGMDHFADPRDELSEALDERRLYRNFMGYTVVQADEMAGVGPSAIGEIGGCYAQNQKRLVYYYRAIDKGRLPTSAGCVLSLDDTIRRWVIRKIMCNFYLDTSEMFDRFGIQYDTYFEKEETALRKFYDEGLLAKDGRNIMVRPLGQLFVRNVAMVFDAYLENSSYKTFSRTV